MRYRAARAVVDEAAWVRREQGERRDRMTAYGVLDGVRVVSISLCVARLVTGCRSESKPTSGIAPEDATTVSVGPPDAGEPPATEAKTAPPPAADASRCLPVPSAEDEPFLPDPVKRAAREATLPVVTIEGVVVVGTGHHPLNRMKFPIEDLLLDTPQCATNLDDPVSRIELDMGGRGKLAAWSGKHVRIRGTLQSVPPTAWHTSFVGMHVQKIELAPKKP